MPGCGGSEFEYVPRPVKVYHGWFGDSARWKLRTSQGRKGFDVAFPDCGSQEARRAQQALRLVRR